MIKFDKVIVQFGFGAIGKSFYEKVKKEIKFNESNYYIITRDKNELNDYINMNGLISNFIVCDINKENFQTEFGNLLKSGDLLIDLADTVGTKDIIKWCIDNNVMYVNTGETDWPDNWYNIFTEYKLKLKLKNDYINSPTIVLQHGNNPGLVSHFVKSGIKYIVNTQFKNNKRLKSLIKQNKYNEVASIINLDMIHINDIDLQEANKTWDNDTLVNTWCIDSFFYEMLSESTICLGTNDKLIKDYKYYDKENGFIELNTIALDNKMNTYYPLGKFEGYLVPHEEIITVSSSLEYKVNDKTIYKPSVVFLYKPFNQAISYMEKNRVNNYPDIDLNKPQDCLDVNSKTIVRGIIYPNKTQILYDEMINDGCEYVGVLLMGNNFNPVWVGNKVSLTYLKKDKLNSYWQTPTITPVAMSALSAVKWTIKNSKLCGIHFPDDIKDYDKILKSAEKYISKTIYKTFNKEELTEELNISFNNLNIEDFYVNKK